MTSMARTGVTTYTTPSDLEIVATRLVDAPRRVVFDAWTDPQHVRQWLLGPEGWTMPICEIDLRPGGKWRYVWRKFDGAEMTIGGSFVEIVPPERLVTTESWGPEWPEAVNTLVLTEAGNNKTTMTLTMRYQSRAVRDAALATGMTGGMDKSFDRLDELVRKIA